ncbi:MAG TPA: hypothetical protein VMM78_06360 [Thermomicrobiales bacterium]|nr:hypothetical protein [Thermomicrobiales bacterium]
MTLQSERVLRTNGLLAEYSIGRAPSGEWFALGAIRSELPGRDQPAWLLVGAGASADAAVSTLLQQMEIEARRLGAD